MKQLIQFFNFYMQLYDIQFRLIDNQLQNITVKINFLCYYIKVKRFLSTSHFVAYQQLRFHK